MTNHITEEEMEQVDAGIMAAMRQAGVTIEDANRGLEDIRQAMQLAQQFFLVHVERCADLGIPPHIALMAAYQMGRDQLLGNLEEGAVNANMLRYFRAGVNAVKAGMKPEKRKKFVMDGSNNLVEETNED